MILSTKMLSDQLTQYSNIPNKIRRMIQSQQLFPLKKGLFETDKTANGAHLSQVIITPSYLSFEWALSYYGLIPESVVNFTCATTGYKNNKCFNNQYGTFIYTVLPARVFPYAIKYNGSDDEGFWIASPEKSICDKLFTLAPVHNLKSIRSLLFDDLRIDETKFYALDPLIFSDLVDRYHTSNIKLAYKVFKGGSIDERKHA